jgi:hypothetical protein
MRLQFAGESRKRELDVQTPRPLQERLRGKDAEE